MNNKAEYIPKIVVYVNCRERDVKKFVLKDNHHKKATD